MGKGMTVKQLFSKAARENTESIEKEADIAQTAIDEYNPTAKVFLLGIVQEVLSDPSDYYTRELEDITFQGNPITVGDVFSGRVTQDDEGAVLSSPYKNPRMADFAPPNSIVALLRDSEKTASANKGVVCLPFFSSHLMMPAKPGESVWVMKFSADVYYWFCRQSSFRQVEDLNYTHSQRESNVQNSRLIGTADENNFAHFQGSFLGQEESSFESIMASSVAYKEEFTGEVVPRNGKRCGDLLLQGSNNSHILLGVEKFEEENTIPPYQMTDETAEADTIANRKPLSPAIDICIFRKSRELFDIQDNIESNGGGESSVETLVGESHAGLGKGLGAVRGERKKANFVYYENEKARDRLSKDSFAEELKDSDIYNCIARIYMSNCKTIDDLLMTPNIPGERSASPQDVLGLGNYGTLAAIGANTRVVGTETLKIQNIVGQSGIQLNPSGDVIIHGARSGGAKIVLEAEGGIRIIPGGPGIVKIGAEGANIAPVGGKPFNADESIADELAEGVNELSEAFGGSAILPTDFTIEPIATLNGSPLINPADIASGRTAPIPGFANYSAKVLLA